VTLVTDTSVILPALVDGGLSGETARSALSGEDLIAPALLDVEVAHALRGRVRGGKLDAQFAQDALTDLAHLPIRRFDAVPLLGRIWQLRENLTVYGAAYVALAEVFDAVLVTGDARLAKSNGPRCAIRLIVSGD
jgi:predicted nucleic acid-binding protein